MKKSRILSIISLLIGTVLIINTNVEAADIEEGKPGQTIHGEYVMIINTNKDNKSKQSTGTIKFDSDIKEMVSTLDENIYENIDNNITADEKINSSRNKIVTKYQIGDKKILYQGKEYICIGEGEHCYIWMEINLKKEYDLANKTEQAAKDIISVYDGKPYKTLNDISSNNIVYNDNSGKLSIVLEEMDTSSGFFAGEEGITAIHIKTKKPSEYTQRRFYKC